MSTVDNERQEHAQVNTAKWKPWRSGSGMNSRKIIITFQDMKRLYDLLNNARDPFGRDTPYLETLRNELNHASLVGSNAIDADVVTMNSTVVVRESKGGQTSQFTLVFPERANPETNHVSVLAPLGAGLLGYRVGDRVSFAVPTGRRTCEIVDIVYQPEAAGDLHL